MAEWLFGLFWHFILYNLDVFIHYLCPSIFSTFLSFNGYFDNFATSIYNTVITGVAFWTTDFHTPECFRRKSLLLTYKFNNIHALRKYVWLYNWYFPCEKSQALLCEKRLLLCLKEFKSLKFRKKLNTAQTSWEPFETICFQTILHIRKYQAINSYCPTQDCFL